ncbi:MAG: polyphosphate kinase 2 family protein [Deltaproteobacteria bacterium]|nr:polyphosphate kinase 2 family protein [Deltaproteobacteria bacterium]
MSFVDRYRVSQADTLDLSRWDPRDTSPFDGDKSDGEKRFGALNKRLEALQELLYADGRHKVLIVLQGMDTAGKDGAIRLIFDGVNPVGVKVASFKRPTPIELAHDYLWRVHAQTPGAGEIVIFNRSHYEDVLVVRVRKLVEEARWQRRYEHIAAFEKLLADEGTTILKFFLHISKEEQRERLQERLDDPEKNWKFDPNDLEERKLWDGYQAAYADALARTSRPWAPWYIIPADKKWYRNVVISTVIVEALEKLGLRHPPAAPGLTDLKVT